MPVDQRLDVAAGSIFSTILSAFICMRFFLGMSFLQGSLYVRNSVFSKVLPWQSFPAGTLYACFVLAAGLSAAGGSYICHSWVQPNLSNAFPNLQITAAQLKIVDCMCMVLAAPLLGAAPCLLVFALFMYFHSRVFSSVNDHSRSRSATAFVQFKDPAMQKRFGSKKIDIITKRNP
jgi:hypothetical protein